MLLVVLYHGGLSSLSGGFIGVDVFFVISGFVITGVLLRERASTGRTSLLAFYGRRCRRILPAASLVIVLTIVLSYEFLGSGAGTRAATDGRWAAVFLANVHFSAVGTNYFSAQRPPSPLQNYWSLAVEEQFYLVYPAIFLVLARLSTRLALRGKLAIGLIAVIGASYWFSVVQTSAHPSTAYFSPLTRAWELALGALVAVSTEWCRRLPPRLAGLLTWIGLAGVVTSACTLTSSTPYPGSLVAIPVVGTALVIAGGAAIPTYGAEMLLRLAPFRVIGRLSYSLYLWHWPILILAAQSSGRTSLSFLSNVPWIVVALGAAALTYRFIEDPIRHARSLVSRRWISAAFGIVLIATTLGLVSAQDALASAGDAAQPVAVRAAQVAVVAARVKASAHRHTVPKFLVPPLGHTEPMPIAYTQCWPTYTQTSVPACVFGDRLAKKTVVLFGDSHAAMWYPAFSDIALHAHWRLVVLTKSSCPVDVLPFGEPGGMAPPGHPYTACEDWRRIAFDRIRTLHPTMVVVTQLYRPILLSTSPGNAYYPFGRWRQGLERAIRILEGSTSKVVVLGSPPQSKSTDCPSEHPDDVQVCSSHPDSVLVSAGKAEEAAARATGARYVDVTQWFCAATCPMIIGHYQVYFDPDHISTSYSRTLEDALAAAVGIRLSR